MLEILRKTKRGVFGVLSICFLATMLIPFGVGVYSGSSKKSAGISVDGFEITPREFYDQLQNWDRYYRAQLKDGYEQLRPFLNLRQRTVEELVNRKLLENFTTKLGLSAGASQIQDKIRSHPFFQGALTRESLQEFLDAQGMTSQQLEAVSKKEIVNEQLISAFTLGTTPSEPELKQLYRLSKQQFSFRYLSFDVANYIDKVDTSNEENLKAFFTDHAEEYRKPRSARFQFIKFAPADYRSLVEVSEEDLKTAYDKNKHLFTEPKQIHLRQIVVKKVDTAGRLELKKLVAGEEKAEDPKKKEAEKILSRVNSGEDFATVAKSASEDEKTATKGGDLGWVKYSDLEGPLRTAAADLGDKIPSSLIEHENAYYILFAEEKKDARVKDFSEVRQTLEDRYRDEDAPVYARARAQEFLDRWLKNENATLTDAAAKESLATKQTNGFVSVDAAAEFAPELIKEVVELGAGSKNIIDVGSDAYVVEVLEAKEAYVPEPSEVRDGVIKRYKEEKSRELARTAATKTLEKLRAENNQDAVISTLDALAKELSVETKSLGPISQSNLSKDSAQNTILASPNATQTAFALSEANRVPSQLIEGPATFTVIALEKQIFSDDSEYEKNKDKLLTAELKQGSTRLISSLITALKARANVSIEPTLLEENS